jgi:hypothetical protein
MYGLPANGTLELAHHGGRSTKCCAAALEAVLYEHRTHHNASTGAGFAKTVVSSTALFAIPLHV